MNSSSDTPNTLATGRARRVLWFAAGWLCFAVGVVGIVLPGVPTTGPMLLALACFARSSHRFHDWLYYHPRFGPPLQRWKRERTISVRVKVIALTTMALSLSYIAIWSPLPMWAVGATAALMLVGAVVVLWIPHRRLGE